VYYASSSFLSDDALDFLAGYTDEIPRASENQPDLYQPGASAAQIFLSQFYDNEFLYPGEAEEIYGDIVIGIEDADPDLIRGQRFAMFHDALAYISSGGLENIARVVVAIVETYIDDEGNEVDVFEFSLEIQRTTR
jgi:hypothetical protein